MSRPRVSSSVPWRTRAKPPITTYFTRWRSSAWRTPYGSNRGGPSAMLARLLELSQEPAGTSLRRQVAGPVESLIERRVSLAEDEWDLEAAGFDDRQEVVDARRHLALFPAGNQRSSDAAAFRKFVLG